MAKAKYLKCYRSVSEHGAERLLADHHTPVTCHPATPFIQYYVALSQFLYGLYLSCLPLMVNRHILYHNLVISFMRNRKKGINKEVKEVLGKFQQQQCASVAEEAVSL